MTFAQFIGSGTTGIIGVLSTVVVPLIIALAFVFFVWSVLNYFLFHSADETERTKGRQFVLWSVLGLVALFSVWGFVNIMLSTLGIAPSA